VQNIFRTFPGSCFLLILISLGTLFFRLGSLPFLGSDEPRYARIAQEMSEQGQWVTPYLEGRPWLEKPPLYYWSTIPFYRIFGVSETTARLSSVLWSLLSACFIYWMGARLWTRLAGFFGAAIFLTCLGAAAFGRSASTDMPLTACLTATLAILGVAATQELQAWKVFAAYLFLGLATLGKGPVAPLLVAGIGFLFWILDERGGFVRGWRIVPGILITAAVSLPWFWLAFRQNGFAFVAIFIVNHNIARYITDIHHHTQPVYYFLPVLPGLLFPWTAWLLTALPRSLRETARNWRRWNRRVLFLACWVLFPFIFFSLSRSKLPGYVLPLLPPLALLIGTRIAPLCEARETEPARCSSRALISAAWTHLGLAGALSAAFPVVFHSSYGETWVAGLPVSAACLVPALFVVYFARRGRAGAAFGATALQGVLLVLTLAQFAFPAIGRSQSAREIAMQVLAHRQGNEPVVTYNYFHHALNYYTGYCVSEDLTDPVALGQYAAAHPRFLVVTELSHLPEFSSLEHEGCTVAVLEELGKLRLLRLTVNPRP
jgi:4-amino-4-deoxy-L-arabinose transferase-like glycosyltransferase